MVSEWYIEELVFFRLNYYVISLVYFDRKKNVFQKHFIKLKNGRDHKMCHFVQQYLFEFSFFNRVR